MSAHLERLGHTRILGIIQDRGARQEEDGVNTEESGCSIINCTMLVDTIVLCCCANMVSWSLNLVNGWSLVHEVS